MVVGTYHFGSPGLDVFNSKVDDILKPQRQLELEALATALAEFDPTKIMLERVAKTPDLIDPYYAASTPADMADSRDERVQIAYRVARRLGHGTVYAIDERHYWPFDKLVAWAKATGAQERLDALMAKGAAAAKRTEELQNQTVPAALAEMNRPEAIESDHSFYGEALGFGDTEQQPGADLNAMWYLRNAKIFAKLQRVAMAGDRVLVIYGAGHNYWLGHFRADGTGLPPRRPGAVPGKGRRRAPLGGELELQPFLPASGSGVERTASESRNAAVHAEVACCRFRRKRQQPAGPPEPLSLGRCFPLPEDQAPSVR